MEKLQLLAMVQAYTGIGIGLMIGLGAAGACIGVGIMVGTIEEAIAKGEQLQEPGDKKAAEGKKEAGGKK